MKERLKSFGHLFVDPFRKKEEKGSGHLSREIRVHFPFFGSIVVLMFSARIEEEEEEDHVVLVGFVREKRCWPSRFKNTIHFPSLLFGVVGSTDGRGSCDCCGGQTPERRY